MNSDALRTELARGSDDRVSCWSTQRTGQGSAVFPLPDFLAKALLCSPAWMRLARRCIDRSGCLRGQIDEWDLLQESWLRARARAAGCRASTEAQARAWFKTVIARTALELARHFRRASINSGSRRPELDREAMPFGTNNSMSAETPLQTSELFSAIVREIARLPSKQAHLIHKICVEGRPISEMAASAGQTEDALRSILWRAKRRLRRRLAPLLE